MLSLDVKGRSTVLPPLHLPCLLDPHVRPYTFGMEMEEEKIERGRDRRRGGRENWLVCKINEKCYLILGGS